MGKIRKKDQGTEAKLIIQEMEEDPFHRFNTAFALMSIIPFLVSVYILVTRLFSFDILVGDVGIILFISILISLGGLFIGYGIIRNILQRVVHHATIAKQCSSKKSSFVATVSHELRNPIFVLSANIEGLLEGMYGDLEGKQKESLRLCKNVTGRMELLVTNLLDLYKIEAGMVKIKKKMCNICELADEQIKEQDILIRDKKISFTRDFPQQNLTVWADENKIIQVINNLLSNAIKYTPEGGEVAMRIYSTGGFTRLEVEDSGPGIPAEKLKMIFNKFERLDETILGTGLGLAIAKDIIELHKGKIWAESRSGKGTKFIIVLPRNKTEF
ncbi:sensor histidine kinase [Candidatus Omnitrophota bacterium]